MEERERERERDEGGIIMAGGCQGEREKQREGKKERGRERVQPTELKPFNW